jgi:hypothetical protein
MKRENEVRPPEMQSGARLGAESAAREDRKQSERRNHSDSPLAQQAATPGLRRLPPNTQMIGVMLDREHVAEAGSLIRAAKSANAIRLLTTWRSVTERFPFLVIAGYPHSPVGGIIGGIAADWAQAVQMYEMASARFDELANASGIAFTAVWLLRLTDDRQARMTALIAESQPVAGSA